MVSEEKKKEERKKNILTFFFIKHDTKCIPGKKEGIEKRIIMINK